MENEETTDAFTKLVSLAGRSLSALEPTLTGNKFVAKLYFTGYDDLLFFISNLIQMSIKQIQAGEDDLPADVRGPYVDTGRMLEIALQLIPHDEAQLLDAFMEFKQGKNTGGMEPI